MSDTLAPQLTPLDERVLDAMPIGHGVRVRRIVDSVQGHYRRYNIYERRYIPSRDDIIGILRGLEHLGYCHQRNGWWRR